MKDDSAASSLLLPLAAAAAAGAAAAACCLASPPAAAAAFALPLQHGLGCGLLLHTQMAHTAVGQGAQGCSGSRGT